MTELADHSTDYSVVEREPPEVMARNLRIAAHLWSSATAFFFAAFLFAYFYLRALDSSAVWRPKHVDPSVTLGTLTAVALVAAAALLQLAVLDHRAGRRPAWRVKGAVALVLLLVAVVLQTRGVVDARLRPDERAVRERVSRLDRAPDVVRVRARLLGRDDARHLDPLPEPGPRRAAGRARLG